MGKDILDEIASTGVIEDETEWNSIESALLKKQTFMSHPILFESSDDLIWAEPERFQTEDLQAEEENSRDTEVEELKAKNSQAGKENSNTWRGDKGGSKADVVEARGTIGKEKRSPLVEKTFHN